MDGHVAEVVDGEAVACLVDPSHREALLLQKPEHDLFVSALALDPAFRGTRDAVDRLQERRGMLGQVGAGEESFHLRQVTVMLSG